MKKTKLKNLKNAAHNMPLGMETTIEIAYISGRDANLTVCGSSPYDNDAEYEVQIPVYTLNNNYRRLKKTKHAHI